MVVNDKTGRSIWRVQMMKRMMLGAICVLAISGLGARGALGATDSISPKGERYVVGITGMVCGVRCVEKVRETLESIDGIAEVRVNFDAKSATLSTANAMDRKTVQVALAEVGYGVSTFESTRAATTYELKLSGLRTQDDVSEVQKAFSKLDGVQEAKVMLKPQSATITMKKGKSLTKDQARKALRSPFLVTSFAEKVEAAKIYTATLKGADDEATQALVLKALKKVEGVDKVAMDAKSKKATITMKSGKTLDRKAVVKALPKSVSLTDFAVLEAPKAS